MFWKIERFVRLAYPAVMVPMHYSWRSTIYHLTPARETELRGADVVGGGALREHFTEFAGSRWRVWPVDEAQCDVIGAGVSPFTFESPYKFAKAFKVDLIIMTIIYYYVF